MDELESELIIIGTKQFIQGLNMPSRKRHWFEVKD